MNLEEFRAKHGPRWAELTRTEMFKDALACIGEGNSFFNVLDFDKHEMKEYGPIIVAQQQGFAAFEGALKNLHVEALDGLADLGPEQYPSPDEETDIPGDETPGAPASPSPRPPAPIPPRTARRKSPAKKAPVKPQTKRRK